MKILKKYERILLEFDLRDENVEKIYNELISEGYDEERSWIIRDNLARAIIVKGEYSE